MCTLPCPYPRARVQYTHESGYIHTPLIMKPLNSLEQYRYIFRQWKVVKGTLHKTYLMSEINQLKVVVVHNLIIVEERLTRSPRQVVCTWQHIGQNSSHISHELLQNHFETEMKTQWRLRCYRCSKWALLPVNRGPTNRTTQPFACLLCNNQWCDYDKLSYPTQSVTSSSVIPGCSLHQWSSLLLFYSLAMSLLIFLTVSHSIPSWWKKCSIIRL